MGRVRELRLLSPLTRTIGLVAASVGVLYGYDLSNIAGALLFLQSEFDLSAAGQELVTTTVVLGEIVGALAGGWLANAVGRKNAMVGVAVGYAVFAVFSAVAISVPTLLAARLGLGVVIGVSVVVVPVFVAESVPAAVRGALLVSYGVATVCGIIGGYLVAYLLAGAGNWRLMLGLAAVPALVVLWLLRRLPDTARWYMLKGRTAEARATLRRVEPSADADAEIAEIARALATERDQRIGAIAELLRPPYLRATIFLVGLGFFIQITGINAIVYYSPRLFETMGFTGNFALLILPALVQVAALATMLIALLAIDRVGRRPLLLTGITVMVAANLLLVAVFAVTDAFGTAAPFLKFAGVLLFTVGYTFGFGSLVWVYAGETLPTRLRSLGSSAMLTSDLVANAIVAAVFLTMLSRLGGAGTFALFGLLALLSFGFVHRYAPETKGRQLEDIRHYWENDGHWPPELATAPEEIL